MNPTIEVLRRHATCRDYTPEEIPDATLRGLVRAAQQCPTDATGQLYSLLWARSSPIKDGIGRLIGDQAHVFDAPVLLIILLDTRRLRRLLEHRGERFGMRSAVTLLFGLTDAGLFAQSLVVAAESEGYGTCYLGSVQNNAGEIARFLDLPEGVVPLCGLTMGRPRSIGAPKPRIPTEHVLHVDAYRDPTPPEMDNVFAVMSKATRSGDWLNPIHKYFAKGGVMERREDAFRALLAAQGIPL
jgi:nitroreductase